MDRTGPRQLRGHLDLAAVLAVTSDFVQAQSPVEGPGTPVDDEGVQGKAPALPASLVQKAADEPAAGAKISVVGVDLDPRQVGLRRPGPAGTSRRGYPAGPGAGPSTCRWVPGQAIPHPVTGSNASNAVHASSVRQRLPLNRGAHRPAARRSRTSQATCAPGPSRSGSSSVRRPGRA